MKENTKIIGSVSLVVLCTIGCFIFFDRWMSNRNSASDPIVENGLPKLRFQTVYSQTEGNHGLWIVKDIKTGRSYLASKFFNSGGITLMPENTAIE